MRGHLAPSTRVAVCLAWLDASQRIICTRGVRFMPSSPDRWTRLRIGQMAPANAAWVGVSIMAAYLLPGDRIDVDDVSLRSWARN